MDKSKRLYFYVYAVVNFEQKLAYIGSRGSAKLPDKDTYMGSYDRATGFKPQKKLILGEYTTRKEAYEAEREWQIKFDVAKSNLFVNKGIHTSSGFSNYGLKFSEERKKTQSKKNKERMKNPEEREKIKNACRHLAKPFSVKDITTAEVINFQSVKEAARFIGINPGDIYKLKRGRILRIKNYCLPETDINQFNKNFELKNIATNEIIKFSSLDEGVQLTGIQKNCLARLVRGERFSSHGYCLPSIKAANKGKSKKPIKVCLKNTITGDIFNFKSMTDAATFLRCKTDKVRSLISKTRKEINGYELEKILK